MNSRRAGTAWHGLLEAPTRPGGRHEPDLRKRSRLRRAPGAAFETDLVQEAEDAVEELCRQGGLLADAALLACELVSRRCPDGSRHPPRRGHRALSL